MIKEKLRRCPFCGKNKGVVSMQENCVICDWCGAQGPPGYDNTERDIIDEWNSRSKKVKRGKEE